MKRANEKGGRSYSMCSASIVTFEVKFESKVLLKTTDGNG